MVRVLRADDERLTIRCPSGCADWVLEMVYSCHAITRLRLVSTLYDTMWISQKTHPDIPHSGSIVLCVCAGQQLGVIGAPSDITDACIFMCERMKHLVVGGGVDDCRLIFACGCQHVAVI